WRDEMRTNGFAARRGQQFSGSPDSPDVVCEQLGWIHFEVKAVERLNVEQAMEQARKDAGKSEIRDPKSEGNPNSEIRQVAILAHKRSFRAWLVTMEAETFFRFLRGDFPECGVRNAECGIGAKNFTGDNGANGG